ncbi:MAG: helix-hairpin-helix domain-containing protein [Thermoplasmata archaeon]|nr:helix-hairpin-helix domain-containing protein [Thermoplasmata archaeon]
MAKEISVLVVDGYIDDPAALGVPPYISPMVRSIAGAALDAGADRVEYLTVDMIRDGARVPDASVSVVLSGNTVPGKYLRSMPMSSKELEALVPRLGGWKLVGGSAASALVADRFDFAIKRDIAASLYDGMSGLEVDERLRTLDEWNRWMMLGADIVTSHQDFPQPLIAEVESYRGCHRFSSGGCSYCVEPTKGRPLMRSPNDIIAEASRLRELGVRNLRVGGQTCIVSYGSDPDSPVPTPVPETVDDLFEGLQALGFDVLHVDNANAAVIASHPDESAQVLDTLANRCTDGNVLALGMESADPRVVMENNLNSTADQVIDAVRMINRAGASRGPRGMPRLLPGINLICGLDGETSATYTMDMEILERIRDEGLMVRRINIRQVLPVRKDFSVRVDQRRFKRFKEQVREDIDRVMLERVAPRGTVLKDVYMELQDGNVTFGRQIGSYPLLIGVPYKVNTGEFRDIYVIDWGFRSITGVTYPFDINRMPMSALEALPGIGRKRAQRIAAERPFDGPEDLLRVLEDPNVLEGIRDIVTYRERRDRRTII